jgi:hypothetical protein
MHLVSYPNCAGVHILHLCSFLLLLYFAPNLYRRGYQEYILIFVILLGKKYEHYSDWWKDAV